MNSSESKPIESHSMENCDKYQDLTQINNNIIDNKLLTNDSSSLMNGRISKRMSQTIGSNPQMSDNSLFTLQSIQCLIIWYFFSFTTLFLNKYIVSYERGDTTMLGMDQVFRSTHLSQ
jgi:hypothetical protein